MDRLEHLGIIQKGLTGYSSPVKICIESAVTFEY